MIKYKQIKVLHLFIVKILNSNMFIALDSTSDPGRLSERSMLFNFCVISALIIANEILKYVTSINICV